jgi:ComF family protein
MKAVARLKHVQTWMLDVLLPPACPFCGLAVARLGACGGCLEDLPWNLTACPGCALPLAVADSLCASCQLRPPPFTRAIAPLRYEFPVDAVLKGYKFTARSSCLPALSSLLCAAAHELAGNVDAVLPMPMHWIRWARRGFNQAVELGRPVARELGVPLLGSVARIRHTAFQSGLDARARRKNLSGAFRVTRPIAERHVLIVDDVMTTGQSCRQLARSLRASGVDSVSVLVVARAGRV